MEPQECETTGFALSSGPLIAGAVLVGAGGLLTLAGITIGGAALAAAIRRWVSEMDVPPDERARRQLARARAATAAGANAWRQAAPRS